MLELLDELPKPYIPAESLTSDCPWDWAIGRDPECYKHVQILCSSYMRGEIINDRWDELPFAEAKNGDYLIIYHEDLPVSKPEMKALFCFHHLKPWLDEFEYADSWQVLYKGEEYGLGIFTPDMYYSFFSKTEEDAKRNRVWAIKNMVNTTMKYSGLNKVITLAACVGNCKKMNKEYQDARKRANINKFGRYIEDLFEPVFQYDWSPQNRTYTEPRFNKILDGFSFN